MKSKRTLDRALSIVLLVILLVVLAIGLAGGSSSFLRKRGGPPLGGAECRLLPAAGAAAHAHHVTLDPAGAGVSELTAEHAHRVRSREDAGVIGEAPAHRHEVSCND